MKQLNRPTYTLSQAVDLCEQGITESLPLKARVTAEKANLNSVEAPYQVGATSGRLFSIPPLTPPPNTPNPNVIGTLTKNDLEKLYEQYFAKKGKPARAVYDQIKNSAQEQCPYCGGIGTPKNVDHYLPKAHFPQFSVLPLNLVPSCRDCNMDGKGHAYATSAGEQIIHPYLDKTQFFDEQWISAVFYYKPNGEPSYVQYFVTPPDHWLQVDKDRVTNHFISFDIAKRYGDQAARELSATLKQIESLIGKGTSEEDIIEVLIAPQIDAYFCNHWKRIMYQSIAEWL